MNDWRTRLRDAVNRSGRKHSAIAFDAGVDRATMSRILNGHLQPRFEVVVRIAHALGESVGSLLQERGYAFSAFEIDRLQEAASIIVEVVKDPE